MLYNCRKLESMQWSWVSKMGGGEKKKNLQLSQLPGLWRKTKTKENSMSPGGMWLFEAGAG